MQNIPLIGYVYPLSGKPGDTLDFKISSEQDKDITVSMVRVVCADPNPESPGIIEHPVPSCIDGKYPSLDQPICPGSYAMAPVKDRSFDAHSCSFVINLWPTLRSDRTQTIFQVKWEMDPDAIALSINPEGCLTLVRTTAWGNMPAESTGNPLTLRHWYRAYLVRDCGNRTLRFGVLDPGTGEISERSVSTDGRPGTRQPPDTFVIAAALSPKPCLHFNGKLESPAIFAEKLSPQQVADPSLWTRHSLVSRWDFSRDIQTTKIVDVGPAGAHGKLVNLPSRGRMGSNWTGRERNWNHCPQQYGAIHFHEDDLCEFDWTTTFRFTIPSDLKSGIYAAKLRCGDSEDNIPFFVCAAANGPGKNLGVLLPTFTYALYGNHARTDYEPAWLNHFKLRNAYPWNPAEYPQYGLSTYNTHRDGSGICHASCQRPLMTLKSGYITFGNTTCSGLRHFQADSHLIAWLEQYNFDYDILTDQELNDQGLGAIERYGTIMTGTHPEYHTPGMLDALMDYRQSGGNLVYPGGNGFYWKIAEHTESRGTLEVRRAEGGIRAWAAEPGEYYHAFDGEYGGLCRRNNRPPQQLAGIGFTAQGKFTGSHYRRTRDSYDHPGVNHLFEGIDDEILGDFGLCGHGAAGFELDRADPALGTTENTVVLARSEAHDGDFMVVPEECLTHLTTVSGEPAEQLIRADMVYQQNRSGSKLFSVGSITFCGSLLVNNGENNISRLLKNVLHDFEGP